MIPGPNSTEMAIHLGFLRAGLPGMLVAGAGFILPAVLIVIGLAWVYQTYGSLPQLESIFWGLKPVVLAIIFHALLGLARAAVKGWQTGAAAVSAAAFALLGANPLVILAASVVYGLGRRLAVLRGDPPPAMGLLLAGLFAPSSGPGLFWTLFLTFLKTGSVLYGSGYVLLAFLRQDFVVGLGWLSDQQLLDAIAIGQVTPGPVFTTATFIGYLVAGLPGALVSTVGIFLPAFVFVGISNPWISRMRQSRLAAELLDLVNAASLGLMAAVLIQLAVPLAVDWPALVIAALAAAVLLRFSIHNNWLILAGILIGVGHSILF
jgi:chromate transporter